MYVTCPRRGFGKFLRKGKGMKKYIWYLAGGLLCVLCVGGVYFLNKKSSFDSIQAVEDQSTTWTQQLASKGEVTADLNGDGLDDHIHITYIDAGEGEQRISELEIEVSGYQEKVQLYDFLKNNSSYSADFKKIMLYDLEENGTEEMLLLFDTRGAGGMGTVDIFSIWLQDDAIECIKMDTALPSSDYYNVDHIYDVEKVLYKGKERLLVRQYAYGEQGHSDGIAERIAIVELGADQKSFRVVEER